MLALAEILLILSNRLFVLFLQRSYRERAARNHRRLLFYLEHNLVVGRWGSTHPQGKFTGVSFHMLCHPQLRRLVKKKTKTNKKKHTMTFNFSVRPNAFIYLEVMGEVLQGSVLGPKVFT